MLSTSCNKNNYDYFSEAYQVKYYANVLFVAMAHGSFKKYSL